VSGGLRNPIHGKHHWLYGPDPIHTPRFLVVVFDGAGAELTAGIKGEVAVHFDAIITGWRLLADQVGDIVVDIWKTDYASYPPLVADSITAADQPTLSADDKADDTSLTGWTTDVADGDTFKFNIDSAATVTRVTLTLALIA
jgi:hypothetical protein